MNSENYFLCELPESLSKKEQEQLFRLYQHGDFEARNKLIIHNLRLVKYTVAKYFKSVEYDKKELNSIGITALIKSIDSFDLNKNINFSTFASKCIANEIISFLRIQNKRFSSEISLNTEINFNDDNDNKSILLDNLCEDTIDVEQIYEDKEQLNILKNALKLLDEKEYLIISLRFGLNNTKPHTLTEIAKILNCTKQNAHAAINKILNKLKYMLQEDKIIHVKKY